MTKSKVEIINNNGGHLNDGRHYDTYSQSILTKIYQHQVLEYYIKE